MSNINKNVVLAFMALGVVVMLGVSLMQRMANPNLTVQGRGFAQEEMPAEGSGGMPAEVGMLMEAIKQNPDDIPTIIKLSELLMAGQEWTAAETFIHRLLTLDPKHAQGHYLHGIILYNTGKHDEAAKSFEQVLAIGEDASARYSLGVLQVYHFKDIDKGIAEFERGLQDPNAHAELKAAIQAELDKAKESKSK